MCGGERGEGGEGDFFYNVNMKTDKFRALLSFLPRLIWHAIRNGLPITHVQGSTVYLTFITQWLTFLPQVVPQLQHLHLEFSFETALSHIPGNKFCIMEAYWRS